jgi:hypothetical protein
VVEEARLEAVPDRLDFRAGVGETSNPASLTIRNAGGKPSGALRVKAVQHDFQIVDDRCTPLPGLSPGETCTFTLRFAPSASGRREAALTLVTEGTSPLQELEVPLRGEAVILDDFLSLSAVQVSFLPTVVGGRSPPARIGLKHLSDRLVEVTFAISGAFALERDGCGGVVPREGCEIEVVFVPDRAGALQGSFTVQTRQLVLAALLSGEGLRADGGAPGDGAPAGALVLAPERLDLVAPVFEAGPPASATLTNNGAEALGPAALELVGDERSQFVVRNDGCLHRPLAPSQRCAIHVALLPTSTGLKRAVLVVRLGQDVVGTIALRGQAQTNDYLSVRPAELQFGLIAPGGRSREEVVRVSNASGALSLGPCTTRTTSAEFVVVADGCAREVGPMQSCEVTVAFAPQTVGPRAGALTLACGQVASVSLSGTGGP